MLNASVEIDGIYYNLNSSGDVNTAEVTNGSNGYSGDIEIPESILYEDVTYSVTSIGYEAFKNCFSLTSITIPNSMKFIEDWAFYDCDGLTSITIPNSVTSIGFAAFYGCNELLHITFPNSLTFLDVYSFYCTAWYDNQPNGIVYAGKTLYNYKGTMPEGTAINIEEGTLSIAGSAFSGCSGLTSITIPNSVTTIGYNAFYDCGNLISITIPNSVTSIGSGAFDGTAWYDNQSDGIVYAGKVLYKYKGAMPEGTVINIEEGTLVISEMAFDGCSSLSSISIPNSVTNIGRYAFRGCNGLSSVTIGDGVTSIGNGTFSDCSGLTSIVSEIQDPFPLEDVFNCYDKDIYATAMLTVPAGTKEKYQSTDGWKEFVNIVEMEEEAETTEDVIKITSAKQTTWCSAYDLDFSNVEGLKAYTATGYHRTKGTIWLTRVKEVPAGEGILLIGDEGEYKVPHKSTTAYYANLMVGTVKAITINETDGEYTNYYLSNGDSGVGFYKVNGSVDLKANRAYLPLLKNTVSGSRGFIGMDFDDDEDGTTGIEVPLGQRPLATEGTQESSIFNRQSNDVYYNLQGQRVDNPGKGLYIRNGKKVVIK